MPKVSISDLPVELFHRISQSIRKKDLLTLVRISNRFQRIFTPMIYANIELLDLSVAHACFRTLATVMGFNLPGMVRSLSIRNDRWSEFNYADSEDLESLVLRCLDKMVGLGDFSLCRSQGHDFPPTLFLSLMAKTSLRSITIIDALDGPGTKGGRIQPDWTPFESPAPRLPNLTSFQLDMLYSMPFAPPLEKYLGDLITIHAEQLQFLAIGGKVAENLISSTVSWPTLTRLEVMATALSSTALFEQTPNLVSLTIRGPLDDEHQRGLTIVPIPSHLLSHLTHFAGSSDVVIQTRLLHGRPLLSCVELDYATFSMQPDLTHFAAIAFSPPPWEKVAGALRQMGNSNVKSVAMYIEEPLIDQFEAVAPFMKSVENLKLYISDDWAGGMLEPFASRFFSRLPNIKSLLLSDFPRFMYVDDDWGRFEDALDVNAQKEVLDGWEEYIKESQTGTWKMEKVGFTALFSWNKRPDGRWRKGKTTTDKRMWHNYEGVEEEENDESEGESEGEGAGKQDATEED